jgi:hypothetical protein
MQINSLRFCISSFLDSIWNTQLPPPPKNEGVQSSCIDYNSLKPAPDMDWLSHTLHESLSPYVRLIRLGIFSGHCRKRPTGKHRNWTSSFTELHDNWQAWIACSVSLLCGQQCGTWKTSALIKSGKFLDPKLMKDDVPTFQEIKEIFITIIASPEYFNMCSVGWRYVSPHFTLAFPYLFQHLNLLISKWNLTLCLV